MPKNGIVYWSEHIPSVRFLSIVFSVFKLQRLYKTQVVDGKQKLVWSTDFFQSAPTVLSPPHVLAWHILNEKVSIFWKLLSVVILLILLACCCQLHDGLGWRRLLEKGASD
jgi:hypothetical protein